MSFSTLIFQVPHGVSTSQIGMHLNGRQAASNNGLAASEPFACWGRKQNYRQAPRWCTLEVDLQALVIVTSTQRPQSEPLRRRVERHGRMEWAIPQRFCQSDTGSKPQKMISLATPKISNYIISDQSPRPIPSAASSQSRQSTISPLSPPQNKTYHACPCFNFPLPPPRDQHPNCATYT